GQASEHPLAAAIVGGARARGVAAERVEDFRARTGRGVTGTLGGRPAALGNRALLDEIGIDTAPLAARAEELRREGQTVVFVADGCRLAGLLGVTDPIKPSAAEAIRALHAEGIRIVMLTGDGRGTAEAVAHALGIDEVHAEVLPDRKAEAVRGLRAEGRVV